jgi:lipoprotein-anchoring transpeptidase ErfK/SrfK
MKSLFPSQGWLAALGTLLTLFIVGCATDVPEYAVGPDGRAYDEEGNFVNPYEPGTYKHFIADPGYPKTSKVWKDPEVLARTTPENSRIVISLEAQRGFLMAGDELAIDYPISSGKSSHPTPPGEYEILEKDRSKRSNAYGKIYDEEGNLVNSDADARTDEVPEGGKFVGASMPYWMRLTWDGVGHHIGRVPRYPASHACIRGPRSVLPSVFAKTRRGTPVLVE